ncbi:hybrid non-ribosomal peptide synthetase/type I polyketide synthase [Duganella sp. HH101]|uniref:hybrid non-ribosomal peptide synthetase/type I polyketide synthase n=1 Tax=Duganella sp. HH101 TaxID=1781066 RepID=UPI0008736847|nr:hybrid non-ribosomal peptide synthetase/type I polyketide synthase [Duganella sp. HH101]OFA06941.1 linear gramicidin synthase subunit D [Duganella sp. HH101]
MSTHCDSVTGASHPAPSPADEDDGALSIAIVGMAGRFPDAEHLQQFWDRLRDGVDCIRRFSTAELAAAGVPAALLDDTHYVKAAGLLADTDLFDAPFFGMSPREAESTDPQHRLFLETAWQALEHAGYGAGGRSIGLYAGSSRSAYFQEHLAPNAALARSIGSLQLAMSNEKDFLCGRVAHQLDLRGPAVVVQTACSTSLVAVHMACQSILNGECDMALAGGVSITLLGEQGYLHTEGGIASPDGHCRAFDAQAAGTVAGNGVGVVVLKGLAAALADGDTIHAVIRGSAINNDGADKSGFTAPSIAGQAAVIREALAVAGLDAGAISYVEAHGTATALGDPIEIAALSQAYGTDGERRQYCAIGSVKTNIGHLDAAAGIAGLLKTVLALGHRQLPPSLHYSAPNPHIDFAASPFHVNHQLRDWTSGDDAPLRAGVSAFGVGGTNAHLIVEQAPAGAPSASRPARARQLLLLSAKTAPALDTAAANLARFLGEHPAVDLADAAFTSQVGRRHFAQRRVLICARDHADPGAMLTFPAARPGAELVFMFPGQGSQHVRMARQLYDDEAAFRSVIDQCAGLLLPHLGIDLRGVLLPAEGQEAAAAALLDQTQITQPALFVVEYALARLLMSWGVAPAALLGHSIGEYVAACLAGVFTLDDALALVARRGALVARLPGGAMLAVQASEAQLIPLLGDDVWLAAVNGPAACSVAGSAPALQRFAERLLSLQLAHQTLPTSHAFHSGLMQPALADFARAFDGVTLRAPRLPFLSNVSGGWITAAQATDPAYWVAHLRQTVRFSDCLATLLASRTATLLEVGPGRALCALARQQSAQAIVAIATQPHAKSAATQVDALLDALGRIWGHGHDVDWAAFHDGYARRRIPLPTYPFERKRYWVDAPFRSGANAADADSSLRAPVADWFYAPSWQSLPTRAAQAQKQKHSIGRHLIFVDRHGLAADLASAITAPLVVQAGDRFSALPDRWTIDPADPAHYAQLFATLAGLGQTIDTITDCRALGRPANTHAPFQQLLALAQACGGLTQQPALTLNVVTNGVYAVLGEEALTPAKAAVLGPCRLMQTEFPHIACRHIDIERADAGGLPPSTLAILLAELAAPVSDTTIALRGRQRWAQVHQTLPMPTPAPDALRSQGHYLITGGLGGIGLAFARYLAQHAHRPAITLVGRSPFPAREHWEHAGPEHAALCRQLRELEARGATVRYIAADIAHPEGIAAVVDGLADTGPVHGILHAAGVAGGGMMQHRQAHAADQVLTPKLDGTALLAAAFDPAGLDFMLLCSSLSAIAPALGQADYCAANACLDAFAWQQHLQGARVIAVNWSAWRDVGMAAALPLSLRGHADADLAISPEEAQQVFGALLASHVPQVLVSPMPIATVIRETARLNAHLAHPPATADATPGHARPELAVAFQAPSSEAEQGLARIWQDLLGIARIGVHDDFFELGGHSLLATQMLSRLRATLHVDLPVATLFEAPTIAALAQRAAGASTSAGTDDGIAAVLRDAPLALSFAQQRLWFLDQLSPGSALHNMPSALRLRGRLDVTALRASLNAVVARHEVLRTSFTDHAGAPVQTIAAQLSLALPVTDLTALPPAERDARVQWLVQDEAQTPFSLAQGPLIRARLLQLGADDHVLLLTLHHIISDGWSMAILMRECAALYAAELAETPAELPPLPIQYADFSHWQRRWLAGGVLQTQLAYWREQLEDCPTLLNLPTDRPRPAQQTHHGATVSWTLPQALTAHLHAVGKSSQATLFMTLAAAYNVLLARYCGQQDICIGTPIASRNRAEIEPLIGFFVNTLVLRTRVDATQSFQQLLAQVSATALAAYAHQDLPFDQLVDALKPQRDTSHTPLFQAMLVLQNTPMHALALPGLQIEPMAIGAVHAQFDLTLSVLEQDGALTGTFEYNSALFEPATIERIARHFSRLLASVAQRPDCRIDELAMLDEAETTRMLHTWNATASIYPAHQAVHQLVEERALQSPGLTALEFEGAQLSYCQLNAQANRLAHRLREQGVGPDVLVGLCAERGNAMIVAILAILKAGGAYLPLDPAYPADRLVYMVADARPAVLLTTTALAGILPPFDAPLLHLDQLSGELAGYPDRNPAWHGDPANLAYVIYTSGSSGQPKGVMLAHGGLRNLVHAQAHAFGIAPGSRVLQFASFNFDASTWEIFMALSCGATLCMAGREELMPGTALEQTLQQLRIEVATLPPVALQLLDPQRLPLLRTIISAGEACSGALAAQWTPGRRFFNGYGPTETTVCASLHLCDDQATLAPPIGKPLFNTRLYILDEALAPVPVGVAGQLYIGGDGLARGYLNRPDLSAGSFIPDPFGARPGGRLYRSGDLARFRDDGNIDYLGRADQQVKIRGFRIEPGEIETALLAQAGVREALVLARAGNGGHQLLAYITGEAGDVGDALSLRAALARTLPEHMLPTQLIMLDAFPLTPNGKIDRAALPLPQAAEQRQAFRAPATATEHALAAIWAAVLQLERIGCDDNFFVLGGHSLLATQMMARAREALGVTLPLRCVFEAPTVGALAQRYDEMRAMRTLLAPMADDANADAGAALDVDDIEY